MDSLHHLRKVERLMPRARQSELLSPRSRCSLPIALALGRSLQQVTVSELLPLLTRQYIYRIKIHNQRRLRLVGGYIICQV